MLNFFKRNGFNKNLILKIFINNYYYLWLFFLQNYNIKIYYLLIKKIIQKYFYITQFTYNFIITSTNIVSPTSFLLNNHIFSTSYDITSYYYNSPKVNFKNYTKNQIYQYGLNMFTIHFIRVQRRYNKRRYSKVRVSSRPSFFAGIALSSIMSGLLWNGSIKSVDWLTAWIVVIDVNLILILIFFYFLFRIYRIYSLNIFVRERGKIKIISSLNILFLNKLLKFLFK